MCSYWDVSRQAFYKERKISRDPNKEQVLLAEVKKIRREQTKLGGRKVMHELRDALRKCGRGFGRDKFFDLLRYNDMLVKRRRKYAVTTNSDHPFYKYKNEMTGKNITTSDQVWVSDITYLRTRNGFVYLSLITDAYSRMIVGWNVDSSLAAQSTVKAAKQAIRQCPDLQGVIHHSDRGIQYCCYAYTKMLKAKNIRISMGEAGNCYDNAMAERVNGILKDEYLLDAEFLDLDHAIKATREAIYLYNYKRPHWSLNLKKPAEVHMKKRIVTNNEDVVL